MSTLEEIQDNVLHIMDEAQRNYLWGSNHKRLNTWHVSDFVSECLRKTQYTKTHPAKFDPSKDLRAKANIDGKFQDARNLAKPKFDPAKHVVDFKKGVAYTPKGKVKVNVDKISKKPASYASKVFKGFKNLAKGIGGRATGIAGMMMATTGTALGSNKSLKSQEGAARRLYNKRKKK